MKNKLALVLGGVAAVGSLVGYASTRTVPPPVVGWNLIGWNDLGMHCMDADYSVFSILPPYNVVHAQLVDARGHLVTSVGGIRVTYEAVADPQGSINTTSAGKSNFWSFANVLYGGSNTPDVGLAGHDMPGAANTPQPMTFDPAMAEFVAPGVPITPYDDLGRKRPYPMMRLVARDAGGVEISATDVVLPVSDEMDCSLCHASGAAPAAEPGAGWVHDANFERDYRLNVLLLHDDFQLANATYRSALTTAGYSALGLHATATAGTPILCARCHATNALPGTGISGISPLTQAMHAGHATVRDPINGQTLDASTNRAACYRCHPGSDTRCLRGAMGSAVADDASLAIQCQSCHGSMSTVGASTRQGWFEEPNCQSCHSGTASHNNGQIRYTSSFEANGQPRVAVDATFATNANTPAPGLSLFRFSRGHGGLNCEACHGATHAIYPASHGNDNVQSEDIQGHAGTLVECTSCHASRPNTVSGGPHGMHPIDTQWVTGHGDIVQNTGAAQCQACHGTDYRGTVLSRSHADRLIGTRYGTKNFWRGFQVGCYACHNGPSSDDPVTNTPPVVQDAQGSTVDQPIQIALQASDVNNDPLTLRVVKQPAHGTVGIVGRTATYRPEPGFAGEDVFTFAAWDGRVDSNRGTVRVARGATAVNYGRGFPGTGGVVPAYTSSAAPVLGTSVNLAIANTSGTATAFALLFSFEPAHVATPFGGVLLVHGAQGITDILPASGLNLSLRLPTSSAAIGVSFFSQTVQVDAGARFSLAFSEGLRLTLGN